MSSVFKRLRKETQLQFLVSAQKLQIELTSFVMAEKNLPKKWRYMIGQGLIAKVDELLDNLNFANSIYPTNKEELQLRVKHQTFAVCNCWQLQNKLIRMIECLKMNPDRLSNIAELLSEVEILIKKWKKSDKERYKELFVT